MALIGEMFESEKQLNKSWVAYLGRHGGNWFWGESLEVIFSSQLGKPRPGHQGSAWSDCFSPGRFSLGGNHQTGKYRASGHRYSLNSGSNCRYWIVMDLLGWSTRDGRLSRVR